ncbi:MAG TPA: fumarylacetoacetate hydrolase family protein [Planctomycetota bacterium]|jgi:2-keto-4-pentenoate hydratase/2-oxohepta-3-ene-1,7-dioic acid hydratase in catechol pathway
MKFGTYQLGHKTSACAVLGAFVYDLAQAFFRHFRRPYKFPDLLTFLQADGPEKLRELELGRMKEDRTVCLPLKEVRLRAPLLRPPKIIGVGLNYRDHAMEQKREPPSEPLLFAKAPNVVIGDGDPIRIPTGISEKVDYEVELGVVIGRPAFRVKRAEALSHVFGYTVFNDVTARDIQQGDKQWFRGKSFDTFAPMGPVIVSADELKPDRLTLELTLNGRQAQKGSTADMIFDVPAIIEYASSCFPLEIGDVFATGTPSGVGVFRTPPVFLKKGDEVAARIEGIGTLRNPVE